jgi:hypothetical protein
MLYLYLIFSHIGMYNESLQSSCVSNQTPPLSSPRLASCTALSKYKALLLVYSAIRGERYAGNSFQVYNYKGPTPDPCPDAVPSANTEHRAGELDLDIWMLEGEARLLFSDRTLIWARGLRW